MCIDIQYICSLWCQLTYFRLRQNLSKSAIKTFLDRTVVCLHLETDRGVNSVTAPPIMNFYPDECWSSWALRCLRSPVAGRVHVTNDGLNEWICSEHELIKYIFSIFCTSGTTHWHMCLLRVWSTPLAVTTTVSSAQEYSGKL